MLDVDTVGDHPGLDHLGIEIGSARVRHGPDAQGFGITGINNPRRFQRGDGKGDRIVRDVRIVFLDQGVGSSVVAVQIIVPALDRAIDKAFHDLWLVGHGVFQGLDGGRIAGIAVIGQQPQIRLEARLLCHRKGFGRDIALHAGLVIGDERGRVKGVDGALFGGKAD